MATKLSKKSQYTVAKVMHWAAGLLIAYNLLSGWRLGGFEEGVREILLMVHSSFGVVIFGMMLFRWWWRRVNRLYVPRGWYKRPSMVIQWVLYPLTLVHVIVGGAVASVIDYDIHAFGFIPFSWIAADSKSLEAFFLQQHAIGAWVLIGIVLVHGAERLRKLYVTDGDAAVQEAPKLAVQESAKPAG
jgi:cytochrome b561